MKLMVLKQQVLARLNGADICLLERVEILKSWGIDVDVVVLLPLSWKKSTLSFLESEGLPYDEASSSYAVDSIRARIVFDAGLSPDSTESLAATVSVIDREFAEQKPQLMWSHYTDFVISAALLKLAPLKLWLDISDNEYPRLPRLHEFPPLGELYTQIRHIMVASPFMEREVRKDFASVCIHRWPNPMTHMIQTGRRTAPGFRWLFVNPVEVKGLSFVLELARRLPQESFLFVGNWMNQVPFDLPPNIEFLPRQKSLERIWPEMKGLLMPSHWQEAFGRLPLEAMANGVPVIVSDRGALPETVNGAALVLPLESSEWIDAMKHWHERAGEWIEKGYSRWQSYRHETTEIYDKLKNRFLEAMVK